MPKVFWWLVAIGVVAVIGRAVYVAVAPAPDLHLPPVAERPAEPSPETKSPETETPSQAAAENEVHYPIEPPAQEKPLPALDKSDATLRAALNDLVRDTSLVNLFQPNEFVRRVAATVDNIPRQKIAQRIIATKPAPGTFAVTGKGDNLEIAPHNAARYAPFIRLMNAVDTEKSVGVYIHFYPLFQRAYEELGYPKSYFNDRLIAAIDHLLATPDVKGPIKLVRPKVFYLYADPNLEALSAGQKTLIRTGNENAVKIKAKLRDLRAELVKQGKPQAQPANKK
ncbi:MAG: hypothetical protein JWN94_200 [Betaproteobacteria bacterium]|nr:hypothetical protein [Betaproteobacteria bacterium]